MLPRYELNLTERRADFASPRHYPYDEDSCHHRDSRSPSHRQAATGPACKRHDPHVQAFASGGFQVLEIIANIQGRRADLVPCNVRRTEGSMPRSFHGTEDPLV